LGPVKGRRGGEVWSRQIIKHLKKKGDRKIVILKKRSGGREEKGYD